MNDHTHRQIMGTEMEWNVGVRPVGQTDFVSLDSTQGRWDPLRLPKIFLPPGMEAVNHFLSNGSRYYMDVGTHPEYATPENTSPRDLLISELAGERVMAESLHQFLLYHENVDEVVLMKRVIDANNEPTGYHLNMSEDRRSISKFDQINSLAWHYATSLPLLGGGAVERVRNDDDDNYDYRYSWGQKALKISHDFSAGTQREKPFINTRDEPHANAEHYWRFHIVGLDPHVLDEPAWMLFGTTSLILAACRQGKMRKIELENGSPNPAAFIANQAKYDLEDNKTYDVIIRGKKRSLTANQINMLHIQDVQKVTGLNAEQQKVLATWIKRSQEREQDVMKLALKSDAVTKLARIRRLQEKAGRDVDQFTEEDLGIDQEYTTNFRATREQALQLGAKALYDASPANIIRSKIKSEVVEIKDEEVDTAYYAPPRTTRAHLRGYLIKNRPLLNITHAEWGLCTATVKDEKGKTKDSYTFRFQPLDGATSRP